MSDHHFSVTGTKILWWIQTIGEKVILDRSHQPLAKELVVMAKHNTVYILKRDGEHNNLNYACLEVHYRVIFSKLFIG